MINFSFKLLNPFKCEPFVNFYCWTVRITRNKSWEAQIYHYAHEWFILSIDLSCTGHDHAGPEIELGLCGYNFCAKIYDNRHWDYNLNKWAE
jgi:hypothetical protein